MNFLRKPSRLRLSSDVVAGMISTVEAPVQPYFAAQRML
jgi:hypothetical protein